MGDRRRILWIHAGGPKTGSSAIQSYLELHTELLQAEGIAYQNKVGLSNEYQISSGNGKRLFDSLMQGVCGRELEALLLSYFEQADALCSSEFFSALPGERWDTLLAACNTLGLEVRVVYFIRNVLPYLRSVHDQAIKRHGKSVDFEAELPPWRQIIAVRTIESRLGDRLQVLHYDSEKAELLAAFLKAIGVKNPGVARAAQVNRALTEAERRIISEVNSSVGPDFGERLAFRFIYANPSAMSDPVTISPECQARIRELYEKDVQWVNERFFGGNAVLSIGLESAPAARQESGTPQPNAEALALAWALDELKEARRLLLESASIDTKKFKWNLATHPDIPADFNPQIYLLLNRDVLEAGVDPFSHYIKHGKVEQRKYATNPGSLKNESAG